MAETCPHHEERGKEIASCVTNISNLEGWVEKIERKVDEHHEKEMAAINALREEISHGRGAVWAVMKIGAIASGVIAFAALLWKVVKG